MERLLLLGCVLVWGPATVLAQPAHGNAALKADVDATLIRQLYGLGERQDVTELLEERALIGRFLKRQKIKATDEAIDRRLDSVERVLAKEGKTLAEALAAIDVTEGQLRRGLSVPVAWNEYLRRTLTEDVITEEFTTHRTHYDGTEWRLAQIFLATRDDESHVVRAQAVRDQIRSPEDFERIARAESESPSKKNGGEIGWVTYDGDVPLEVAAWACEQQEPNAVSDPIVSSYGVHIVRVIDVRPGSRPLEDARKPVILALSDMFWRRAVAEERARLSGLKSR